MAIEYTDAVVSHVLATIRGGEGRSASVQLTAEGIELHRSRPAQGKKAFVSYETLFELALKDNPKFFNNDYRRKS
jgi:hypothetical protein